MCYGLSDQHPIERVAMWARQTTGSLGVGYLYREFPEPLIRDTTGDIGDRLGAR